MRTKIEKHLSACNSLIFTWALFFPLFFFTTLFSGEIPSLTLTQRQICDLELILNEGFSPLKTFMGSEEYDSVVNQMRLSDGTLWPIPIVLDAKEKQLEKIQKGTQISLKDQEGYVLALLDVSEIWKPNKQVEAQKVYGTEDVTHPGVNALFNGTGEYYLTGQLTEIQKPQHFDFIDLRKSPKELKAYFKENRIENVIAFLTRNPIHRAHLELTLRGMKQTNAHLLIHPAVGMTKSSDIDYSTRVKCYKKTLKHFSEGEATLNLLPIAMRMGGPREALWHAIVQKNYGCTHFILGRDHGGAGKDEAGNHFYDFYAAQELVQAYADEVGITIIPFQELVYIPEEDHYQPINEVGQEKDFLHVSGTYLKKLLNEGKEIPQWFIFSDVVEELRKVYPPRSQQGFTLFFTGLSGSGKSTIAKAVSVKLAELQERPLTILDGDVIRHHLSSELGFSKEHRAINVRRVGFVASEITKNRGIAICPMIAPYEVDRRYNRELISQFGTFIEIYISTPVDTCAARDTKGFYQLAMEGKITGFTGVNDPYEEPQNPEIRIDTSLYSLSDAVDIVLDYLYQGKYINKE